jgi:hypothetical protein
MALYEHRRRAASAGTGEKMPRRTAPILYRDLLEDAAIILGALDKIDGPRTGE